MDKKKPNWMSEAGRLSGERHARLEAQRLRARSPMQVFAEATVDWLILILMIGGILGAIYVPDVVLPVVEALIGGMNEPSTVNMVLGWLANRTAGFVVGVLAAFLVIDIPLTLFIAWLKKHRPELFQPR